MWACRRSDGSVGWVASGMRLASTASMSSLRVSSVNSVPSARSTVSSVRWSWYNSVHGATSHTAAAAARPGRILLVEDSETNQELFRAVLAGAGHVVEIAPNGRAALDALDSRPFDLVLMDGQMPVMGGMETARAIRGSGEAFADVPIVRKRIDNARLNTVMSNSFGFGGTNACLVFQRHHA